MKKDKLYTYGKKGNIFWPGGELNSYGWMPEQMTAINSYPVANTAANYGLGTYQAPTFQTATISSIQPQIAAMKPVSAPTTSTKSGSTDWGGIAGAAAAAAPREAFDILDPVYHLAAGRETKVGNALSDTGVGLFKAGASSGNAGLMIAGAAAKIGGGLINAGWGVKENKKNTAAIKENTALAKSVGNELGSASTNSDVLNAASNMTSSLGFKASDLYKNGWFTKKGTKKGNALRNQEAGALAYQNHALTTGAENADYNMDSNIMRNFAAFGGPIDSMGFIEDMPATSYGFMKDYLTQREKQIDSKNKLSGISPTNAFCGGGRMFHGGGCLPMMFDFGGNMGTNSSDFPTGLTHIDAGGSHEINPNEGVQVGVDQEGTPNLVEEGETIFNDYVFSNRIEVPQEAQKRLGVKGKHLTFAEAAKQLEKEIKERANDPISKAGFKAAMEDLEEEQEFVKRCSMYSVGEVYDVDSNELMLLNQNGYEYKKLE